MADKDISGPGYRLVIRTGSLSKKMQEAVLDGLKACGQRYYEAVIRNISLDDHTLEELRRLGYPYAKKGSGEPVHEDDRLVHEQSGELKNTIKVSEPSQQSGRTFAVQLTSDAPYLDYLINGTSRMRPRNFPEKALEDLGREGVFDPLRKALAGVKYKIEETR